MRWAPPFLILAACACNGALGPTRVELAPLPLAPPPVVAVKDGCHITGSGELLDGSFASQDFLVFESLGSTRPLLQIQKSSSVSLTWSELPRAAAGLVGRARVDLGGQHLLRMRGYASLEGRSFQIRDRAFAVPSHLWALGGSDVELRGTDGDALLLLLYPGLLEKPETIELRTRCENLVYEPEPLPAQHGDEPPPEAALVVNRTEAISLFPSPGEPSFLDARLPAGTRFAMSVLESRKGWRRVSGELEHLGFDAWVPAGDVEEVDGLGLSGASGGSRCGGMGMDSARRATVRIESQLFVGSTPIAVDGAFFEVGAEVRDRGEQGGFVQVTFEENELVAVDDRPFWIARSALDFD